MKKILFLWMLGIMRFDLVNTAENHIQKRVSLIEKGYSIYYFLVFTKLPRMLSEYYENIILDRRVVYNVGVLRHISHPLESFLDMGLLGRFSLWEC